MDYNYMYCCFALLQWLCFKLLVDRSWSVGNSVPQTIYLLLPLAVVLTKSLSF